MAAAIPVWLDLRRLPKAVHAISGEVATNRLPRLVESGCEPTSPVILDLELDQRNLGSARCHGHIRCTVSVICQRCLEPMSIPVHESVAWELVGNDRAEVDDDHEPIVVDDGRFELIEAVTDQILLAVPAYPRHDGPCPGGSPVHD